MRGRYIKHPICPRPGVLSESFQTNRFVWEPFDVHPKTARTRLFLVEKAMLANILIDDRAATLCKDNSGDIVVIVRRL